MGRQLGRQFGIQSRKISMNKPVSVKDIVYWSVYTVRIDINDET